MATPEKPSHRAMTQAAEWYALLTSRDVSEHEQASWKIWLATDPENRLAWQYVESISSRFSAIKTTPEPRRTADGLLEANNRLKQRRMALKGIACLAGVGILGFSTWRHTPLPMMVQAWRSDHQTTIGESKQIILADGTRIWLNTATAINQYYDDAQRHLQLIKGEILIETAQDARPFFVETAQGRMQALGTRFTVRLDEEHTFLAVYDGAVKAATQSGKETVIELGQQIRFSPEKLGKVQQADIAREAWSRGVFIAEDISLRKVVEELGRYRKGYLGVAPEVANLRVLGQFPLYDSDKTLDMIAAGLPVRIHRPMPWWVTIEPK